MFTYLKTSLIAIVVLMFLLGVIYPVVMTLAAMVIAPSTSIGSVIQMNNKSVGSVLIGQQAPGEDYFIGRPSAVMYGTIASGASNLGPLSQALKDNIRLLRDSIAQRDGVPPANIAPELLTTSASGVDPHISPQGALQQVKRIAMKRNISEKQLRSLIEQNTEPRMLGFLGAPRVNVLNLNIALASMTTDQ